MEHMIRMTEELVNMRFKSIQFLLFVHLRMRQNTILTIFNILPRIFIAGIQFQ